MWVTECIGLDPLEVEKQMCVRWPNMAQRLQTECEFWDLKLNPFGSASAPLYCLPSPQPPWPFKLVLTSIRESRMRGSNSMPITPPGIGGDCALQCWPTVLFTRIESLTNGKHAGINSDVIIEQICAFKQQTFWDLTFSVFLRSQKYPEIASCSPWIQLVQHPLIYWHRFIHYTARGTVPLVPVNSLALPLFLRY